ncbi:MAG: hypothetical protein EOM20_05810 [Spartobacteria bacterium]|nr:hypothetical protein [Spartobacteria bacterium]
MDVPGAEHVAWKDVVTCRVRHDFEFLAAKIFMGRIILQLQDDSSPEAVARMASELRELFVKNIQLPLVQRDVNRIFNN